MNPLAYIVSPLLMLGAHETGHQIEADRQNVPMAWRGTGWVIDSRDRDEMARISGAGFGAQDTLSQALSGVEMEKPVRLSSAANKLGYLLTGGLSRSGDLEWLDAAKGDNAGKYALGISALADLYKAYNPDPTWDLGFWQGDNGTPGLQFTYRW